MAEINFDLSLDEIIKKTGTKVSGSGNRHRRNDRAPGFKGKVRSQSNFKRRSSGGSSDFHAVSDSNRRNNRTPAFKGKVSPQNKRRSSGGAGDSRAASGSTTTAHLSNLPFDVTQQELNELFAKFRLPRIVLHYDYTGKSLGTADLHGPPNVIARIAHEFKQTAIDGRLIQIEVTGGDLASGIKSRIRRVSSGLNGNSRASTKKTNRRPKKTRRGSSPKNGFLSRL
jgi:RNA recognition motif-containing protein